MKPTSLCNCNSFLTCWAIRFFNIYQLSCRKELCTEVRWQQELHHNIHQYSSHVSLYFIIAGYLHYLARMPVISGLFLYFFIPISVSVHSDFFLWVFFLILWNILSVVDSLVVKYTTEQQHMERMEWIERGARVILKTRCEKSLDANNTMLADRSC